MEYMETGWGEAGGVGGILFAEGWMSSCQYGSIGLIISKIRNFENVYTECRGIFTRLSVLGLKVRITARYKRAVARYYSTLATLHTVVNVYVAIFRVIIIAGPSGKPAFY